MSEAERAFYEWFHKNHPNMGGIIEYYREAFMAGWFANLTREVQVSDE